MKMIRRTTPRAYVYVFDAGVRPHDQPMRTGDVFHGEPVLVLGEPIICLNRYKPPIRFARVLHARQGLCMINRGGLIPRWTG